jgi:Domain of unknown function (DUF4347)/FG-GAP-like repeat
MNTAQISQTTNHSQVDVATTLVVFDSRVQDLDLLYSALLPGSIGFTIRAQADGLETITDLLTITGAKYLAIVAHGEPGAVHLGQTTLNIGQLQAQSHLLQQWDVAEIALYSCEVAQGDLGRDFIYQLSELTGATVAAAAKKTGNRALGGSWDLAVTTGAIAAPILFETSILEGYPAVLAVSFGAASYLAASTNPRSVTVGDFNGDGKLDLAAVNAGSSNVSLRLGNGTGGFTPAGSFGVGSTPYAVTAGDFNGDGNLDLATANSTINSVSVVFGDGTGGFGTVNNFLVGNDPRSVTVGDFNADGKLDLATANFGSNNVSVLLGDGTGGFGDATNLLVGNSPTSVTAVDFGGFGRPSLVTTNAGSNSVSVLLRNGRSFLDPTNGFDPATNFTVGSNPSSVTAGDFNGDGDLDLAVANTNSGNVSVLLSDRSVAYGFGAATNFRVGDFPASVTAGDFNGDGKLDLATANSLSGNVSVLSGNGSGRFDAATNFGVGANPQFITAGDFNRDGKLDFATANSAANTLTVRLNTSPTFVPNYFKNDFNGDRKSDILWRNDNGNVALWQMNGATVTTSPTLATAVPTAWQIAGTGDFNGDRQAEILWRNTTDGSISIGQYNSNPQTAPSIVGIDPTTWKVASTADFNGDAKSDILWRNTNGDVAIWQMNGGASTSQTVIANVTTDWKISGTGDFNGDGKADMLWRNDDGSIALWQMNGSALLSPTSLTSTPSVDSSWKINGIADFNGDGKSDILWRNDNGQVAVWTMDGATALSKDLISPNSIVDNSWKITGTSDFSSDGKADILWRNNDGSTAIWEMNGATVASSSLTSVPVVDTSWKIAAPIL